MLAHAYFSTVNWHGGIAARGVALLAVGSGPNKCCLYCIVMLDCMRRVQSRYNLWYQLPTHSAMYHRCCKSHGLSWPTLDKPFWLDVGNISLSLPHPGLSHHIPAACLACCMPSMSDCWNA